MDDPPLLGCLGDVGPLSENSGGQRALFVKNALKPGSKTVVNTTFGSYKCINCRNVSKLNAWALSPALEGAEIGMNLGYIDPPLTSFTYEGITYEPEEYKYSTRNGCGCECPYNYCPTCEENPKQPICSDSCLKNCQVGYKENPGATIIHEFCHLLGMQHEHQNNLNNSNPIVLNRENVINSYLSCRDPNNCTLAERNEAEKIATRNVLTMYGCTGPNCAYVGSDFDPDSIMLYYLKNNWVIGKNPSKVNFSLSAKDKEWLSRMYPRDLPVEDWPELIIRFVDKDAPRWKEPWVEGIVNEKLVPFVGVKFKFIRSSGQVSIPSNMYINKEIKNCSSYVCEDCNDQNKVTLENKRYALNMKKGCSAKCKQSCYYEGSQENKYDLSIDDKGCTKFICKPRGECRNITTTDEPDKKVNSADCETDCLQLCDKSYIPKGASLSQLGSFEGFKDVRILGPAKTISIIIGCLLICLFFFNIILL